MPYWAELWPSGQALGRALLAQGRGLQRAHVLELGCGLGLPSIVAARLGAQVLATDWSPDALAATMRNAALNDVALETLLVRWDEPAAIVDLAPWDLVLASDVLYERRNGEQLLELLPQLVGARGSVLLADPGRPARDSFLAAAADWWTIDETSDAAAPRVRVYRLANAPLTAAVPAARPAPTPRDAGTPRPRRGEARRQRRTE